MKLWKDGALGLWYGALGKEGRSMEHWRRGVVV